MATIGRYKLAWSPKKTWTDDGYQVTMYNLKGREEDGYYPKGRPPLLMLPGMFDDAASWLEKQTPLALDWGPMPIMLQLADAGYDVWVGNVRGTEYATEHKTLKHILPDYWNFTWDDIARYDIPAMMNLMKAATKQEKIFFMGYSHGATAMIQLLQDPELGEDIANSLHKVIALSPCAYYRTDGLDESYFENGLYKFPEEGIHSILGPNWDRALQVICEKFSTEVCEEYTNLGHKTDYTVRNETVSTLSLIHQWQSSFQKRIQKYAPNYMSGEKQTEQIDPSKITNVRFGVLAPQEDELCVAEALAGLQTEYIRLIPDVPHKYFDVASDKEFVDELISQLTIIETEAPPSEEEEPAKQEEVQEEQTQEE